MIKLRVEGLPAEVEEFIAGIEPYCDVLSQSQMYTNRGESRYVRVYLDAMACKTVERRTLEKVLRWLVQECNEDVCKLCIYLKDSQWDGGGDIPEDVEPCKFRRKGGDTVCVEGICKYFAKNPTSDVGVEKK